MEPGSEIVVDGTWNGVRHAIGGDYRPGGISIANDGGVGDWAVPL